LIQFCIYQKKEENHEFAYSTEEFPANLIQAYADDIILISNSSKGLQSLIND
jgi:lipid II:glycine glycyltransferase (peptidoglycan interpeptide bridge formation enzyme)